MLLALAIACLLLVLASNNKHLVCNNSCRNVGKHRHDANGGPRSDIRRSRLAAKRYGQSWAPRYGTQVGSHGLKRSNGI
jgi:hypothetical protein